MAIFTTNQVRQMYTVSAVGTGITNASAVGTIEPAIDGDRNLYFTYRGVDTMERSDLIHPRKVRRIKVTTAAEQLRYLQRFRISLDPTINGGLPIAGQEYLLRIVLFEYLSLSPETQYTKYGDVFVPPGSTMTALQFYTAMRDNLIQTFQREEIPLFGFEADANGVYITELELPWSLGTKSSDQSYFDVFARTIDVGGTSVNWGVVDKVDAANNIFASTLASNVGTAATFPAASGADPNYAQGPTYVQNSKMIADMEYFYHGERGDTYRNVGWPKVIPTQLLVNSSKADGYYTIDIEFYFDDYNHNPQKSNKYITLICPDAAITNDVIDAINAVWADDLPHLPETDYADIPAAT